MMEDPTPPNLDLTKKEGRGDDVCEKRRCGETMCDQLKFHHHRCFRSDYVCENFSMLMVGATNGRDDVRRLARRRTRWAMGRG